MSDGSGALRSFPSQVDVSQDDETIVVNNGSCDKATIDPRLCEDQHHYETYPTTIGNAEVIDRDTLHHPEHLRSRFPDQASTIPIPTPTPSVHKPFDCRRSPYSLRNPSQRLVNRKKRSAQPKRDCLVKLALDLIWTMIPGHTYKPENRPMWWPLTLKDHFRPTRLNKARKPDVKIIAYRLRTDTATELIDLLRAIRVELEARPVQGVKPDSLNFLDSIEISLGGSGRLATEELSTKSCLAQDRSVHDSTQLFPTSVSGVVDPPLYGSPSKIQSWSSDCYYPSTPMFPPLPTFDDPTAAEGQVFEDAQCSVVWPMRQSSRAFECVRI